MRKIFFSICLFLSCISVSAQDIISSFLGIYNNDTENFEVTTIGKKMIDLLSTMNVDDKETSALLSGLESIRIISSTDTTLNKDYYSTARQLLNKKSQGFEELMSVQGDDENLVIMTKESKGHIKELVLLSGGGKKKGFNIISLSGNINLETLAKYSKNLNINGLEKLEVASSNKK